MKNKNIQSKILNFNIQKLLLQLCSCVFLLLITYCFVYADGREGNGCSNNLSGFNLHTAGAQSTIYGSPGDESFAANNLLNLTVLLEGSWNGTSQVPVTITCDLRSSEYPHGIVESATTLLNTNGEGLFVFSNLSPEKFYYIVVKNRNSIETWSSTPISIYQNRNQYDFTTASSQAFGDNMILKDGRYCIYSGDINQDGTIDIQDLSMIDNVISGNSAKNNVSENSTKGDAKNNSKLDKTEKDFSIENTPEDCTGDNVVDVSDGAIVDNNVFKNITVITPLAAKAFIVGPKDKKSDNEGKYDDPNKENEIKK